MTFTKIPTNCHWCGELRLLTLLDDSDPVRREWICDECRQRADQPVDPEYLAGLPPIE